MLAGRMKLNHFLLIILAVGGAGVAALVMTCGGDKDDEKKKEETVATKPAVKPVASNPVAETREPTPVATPTPEPLGRDVDQAVLAYAGKDLGSAKVKDALKGRAFKVNLYQDGGVVSRAKIDLDRDGKWDEKWTFDGGKVTRKVAENDDENYGSEQAWTKTGWGSGAPIDVLTANAASAPDVASADNPQPESAGEPAREVDTAVIAYANKPLGAAKKKDVFEDKPFKVNFYQDSGSSTVSRAKIDLDRDDKWDEKWTFDGPKISRKVAPSDDENYTAEHVWDGGAWVNP